LLEGALGRRAVAGLGVVVGRDTTTSATILGVITLGARAGTRRAEAGRSEPSEGTVEHEAEEIAGVGEGADTGYGVHRPIEGKPSRVDEEQAVECRQVEEGESPGD
jgi:hypothetical protein